MLKETNDENSRLKFPRLYMKTPMVEETLKLKDGVYLVNSRIEICVYKKSENEYCSVISKDIVFSDGYTKTVLLKYIENAKTYDDVLDLTDDFMDDYNRES